MEDFDLLHRDRYAHVDTLVRGLYKQLAPKAVEKVKALPTRCRLSGDDSGLASVWEELKYQLRREESIFLDAYRNTIFALCLELVRELDQERRTLLWLWSDHCLAWEETAGILTWRAGGQGARL